MDWITKLKVGGAVIVAVLYAVHRSGQRRNRQERRERFGIGEDRGEESIEPEGGLGDLLHGFERTHHVLGAVGTVVLVAGVVAHASEEPLTGWILVATGALMLAVAIVWYMAGGGVVPDRWRQSGRDRRWDGATRWHNDERS